MVERENIIMGEGSKDIGLLVATRSGEVAEGWKPRDNFEDIQRRILSEDTSTEERRQLITKRDGLLQDMEEKGMIEWSVLENTILARVKNNDWDDVYGNILNLAEQEENLTRNTEGFRRLPEVSRTRYRGAVEAAVQIAAMEVRTQGLRQTEEQRDDYAQFLHDLC